MRKYIMKKHVFHYVVMFLAFYIVLVRCTLLSYYYLIKST